MVQLTPEQLKAVDTIISNFDVTRVLNAMHSTSWRWLINGRLVPPTKPDILITARKALIEAIRISIAQKEDGYYSVGGLEASCVDNYLTLKFVLTTEEYDMDKDLTPGVQVEEDTIKDYESVVKQYARAQHK
jgi:hypothetical protein